MAVYRNILLIDDDRDNNFINKLFLRHHGIAQNVIECVSVKDAIDYLERVNESQLYPDVILLDINMPFIDGFEFLAYYEKLRFQKRNPKSKLFILSTTTLPKDIERTKEFAFVKATLIKPLNSENIKALEEV